jgi:hypothetical protein
MAVNELQHIVILEAICLVLIGFIILSAFNHWKLALCASISLTSVAFFAAWSSIMALGSLLVYGTAPILLWLQLDKKGQAADSRRKKYAQNIAWIILAVGVTILILNNIRNIFIYLRYPAC